MQRLLFLIFFIPVIAIAQSSSEVIVYGYNDIKFNLFLNNEIQNSKAEIKASVSEISEGIHKMEMRFEKDTFPTVSKILSVEEGNRYTLKAKRNINSEISLRTISVEPLNKVRLTLDSLMYIAPDTLDSLSIPVEFANGTPAQEESKSLTEFPEEIEDTNTVVDPYKDCKLTQHKEKSLVSVLKKLREESDRMSFLENNLKSECLSNSQIEMFSNFLELEDNRLEFVKLQYANAMNKADYMQLERVFKYSIMKKQFKAFVLLQ